VLPCPAPTPPLTQLQIATHVQVGKQTGAHTLRIRTVGCGETAAVIVAGGFYMLWPGLLGKVVHFVRVCYCVSLCGSFVISFVAFFPPLFYWLIFGHEIWSN